MKAVLVAALLVCGVFALGSTPTPTPTSTPIPSSGTFHLLGIGQANAGVASITSGNAHITTGLWRITSMAMILSASPTTGSRIPGVDINAANGGSIPQRMIVCNVQVQANLEGFCDTASGGYFPTGIAVSGGTHVIVAFDPTWVADGSMLVPRDFLGRDGNDLVSLSVTYEVWGY